MIGSGSSSRYSGIVIIPGFWSWRPKKDQEFKTRFGLVVSFEGSLGYLSPCLKKGKTKKEKKWQLKTNEGAHIYYTMKSQSPKLNVL